MEIDRHLNVAFNNDLQSSVRNLCDDTRTEKGQVDFKVPFKRKKTGEALIGRHAKKADI